MKFISYVCFILLLVACGAPGENSFIKFDAGKISIPPDKGMYIKTPSHEDVSFQGLFNYDEAELNSGNMGYPGGTTMFLASIFAHAVTADSMQNSEKTEIRKKANAVLMPYKDYLKGFDHEKLVSSIVNVVDEHFDFRVNKYVDDVKVSGWVLNSKPVFFMTQDQRELILKHAMTFYRSDDPESILYRNIVEIAHIRIDADNQKAFWVDENNLIKVSSELYTKSIELFVDDMMDKYEIENSSEKTYRYLRDGKQNYERGVLVKNECGQKTIRTLRGWLKSFPTNDIDSSVSKEACV